MELHCPGKDSRTSGLNPSEVFEIKCPECGAPIEFWRDEVHRKCEACGKMVENPKAPPPVKKVEEKLP
jgi:endogenous inhibitor of DNA gyrase (YacG/DUF329 family)